MKKKYMGPVTAMAVFALALFINTSLFAQVTPDLSFGVNGQVITKYQQNHSDLAQSVSIAPNGKIVIAGNSSDISGFSNTGIVRYKSNGKLDMSFNTSGMKTINSMGSKVVAVQPNNKIVVCGGIWTGTQIAFQVCRLNANGTPDSTFGTNGSVIVKFNDDVTCNTMTLQSDGKILVGGYSGTAYGGYTNLVIFRLTNRGKLDKTFDGDGKFSFSVYHRSVYCYKLMVQPDGKIIAAGRIDTIIYYENFVTDFFAARLNANGTLDQTFGNNGWGRYSAVEDEYCYTAGLLPDGRIVLAGFSKLSTNSPFSALVLHTDGTIDNSFGTNGWQYVEFGGGLSFCNAVIVQTNGKIILAGTAFLPGYINAVGLARLNGNGTMDNTFGPGGISTSFPNANGMGCNDAVLQPDGKIVVTGYSFVNGEYNYMTARYLNTPQLKEEAGKTNISSLNDVYLFPNPVNNGSVNLFYNLKAHGTVSIEIRDIEGCLVMSLEKDKDAGLNQENLQIPEGMTNGIYFCTIRMNSEVKAIKFELYK